MSNRNYWLDLFTGVTWEEFKKAGGKYPRALCGRIDTESLTVCINLNSNFKGGTNGGGRSHFNIQNGL